jgi:hypothetical protein
VPFGFTLNVDGVRLVANKREQGTIARARALRARGLSLRATAARLAAEGHASRAGRQFLAQQVARMLDRATDGGVGKGGSSIDARHSPHPCQCGHCGRALVPGHRQIGPGHPRAARTSWNRSSTQMARAALSRAPAARGLARARVHASSPD